MKFSESICSFSFHSALDPRNRQVSCFLGIAGYVLTMVPGICIASATDSVFPDRGGLAVSREGAVVYVRSTLSRLEDVVIPLHIGPANGQVIFGETFLVSAETPMDVSRMAEGKWAFHAAFDDATPWNLNGTYIGANHGASDLIQATSPAHGLREGDLGSVWKDDAGISFYLLEIKDGNIVHLLSENSGTFPRWKFTRSIAGKVLTDETTGRILPVQAGDLVQLTPACRIRSQQFLADGRPLEDGVSTPCRNFEVVEEYDIIAPDSVLEAVKAAPGRKINFVAGELDAVLNNRIVYRFQPGGACEILHRATALRDVDLGYMGFIQATPLHAGEASRLLSYIPKTLPFAAGGRDYDFRGLQNLSERPAEPLIFSFERGNIADVADLPDRFIQILQEGEKQVGFAMGYSLFRGTTKPAVRAAKTGSPLFIHTTRKTYPAAVDGKAGTVTAGDDFECLAYRQYFDPRSHPEATCLYGHMQDGDYILYADFHRPVEKTVLPFPRELCGKKFEVIEQSDSIEIQIGGEVPAEGVEVAVRGERGSVLLRIRREP
ncbi:MAG: hypothetical protein NTV93_07655 [Verrucomicrobia bacterium]|nr:hypothetical protein [Verrucomicrobiota bacterium]